jgi:hypothetical protein
MPDHISPNGQPVISFVDKTGRTITMPAPPRPTVPAAAAPPAVRTDQDTNLKHTIVNADGSEREVAVTMRSDSIQDIFERAPSWLTRWGSTLVIFVLGIVLTLMATVPYPTTVTAATRLENRPGGQLVAQLSLPVAATTDLQLGQRVILELDKYPASRFGYLGGNVQHILPPATHEGEYLVTVNLPGGLTTTERTELAFEQGLNGSAEIVVDEQSLLSKVLK